MLAKLLANHAPNLRRPDLPHAERLSWSDIIRPVDD
jgi:hypothetical protein